MFALSNRSFRNAGLAFYGLGSLASLGMISDQASAQTLADKNIKERAAHLAARCDHLYSKPPEHAGCYAQEALNWERARGAAAERRGAEADRRIDALSAVEECGNFLKAGRDKSFTREKVLELAGGKITADNMCEVARKLGYVGRKAALESPKAD